MIQGTPRDAGPKCRGFPGDRSRPSVSALWRHGWPAMRWFTDWDCAIRRLVQVKIAGSSSAMTDQEVNTLGV